MGNWVFYQIGICTLYVPEGTRELFAAAEQWNEFQNIEEYSIYKLIDGEEYTATENQENVEVEYIRTFNNTTWQALYLPFDMSYEEWSPYVEIAELFNVRGYDYDDDGVIDDVHIDFNRLTKGSIKPNMPYIVKAKNTGKVSFSCSDKKLCAAPIEEGTVECSSTKLTYTIHGIYETKTDLYATGAYALSNGQFCHAANASVTLSPYRTYLTITPKSGGYNDDIPDMSMKPKRIILSVDGEEEVSGVDDCLMSKPQDTIYYNLMGRRVENPTNGIYILNGKKIYIK